MTKRIKNTLPTPFTNVQGSGGGGGGGKGGKGSREAVEAPNTLRSKAIARVMIAYSEGPVGGINSYKNIYLDETPLMNPDGTINFPGVTAYERYGTPNQTPIEGFSEAENTIQVNTDLKVSTGPVVRAVSAASIDSVRIVLTFPSMVAVDKKTGDQNGTSVSFRIEVKDDAVGVWESRGDQTVQGKCVSPYQRGYRVARPTGTAKWSWRVTRLTGDSTETTLQNSTQVSSFSEIEESRQTYNNTALVAVKVDTSLFGNSIPTLSIRADGVLVDVPSNYNQVFTPGATTYNGVWDGTFKSEATSNPIWHLYELITNDRYGMGIDSTYLNKFDFYALARYCDGVDSNGKFVGVPDGLGGFRPRFTIQTQINTQEEAMSLIQTIVGSIRGMAYWGAGVVQLNTDRPKQSVKLFTNANVIDGKFTYSGTESKERYTEANITYNNPNDFFRQDITTYVAPGNRYSRNVLNVTKYGCANEAEALMYGKWMVDTSQTQTETLNFSTGIEGGVLRPGDVFEVADDKYQGKKYGGRVMPGSTQGVLVTDVPVTLTAGKQYNARVVGPDGQTIMQGIITNDKNGGADTQFAVLGFPAAPPVNHVFIIAGDDIKSRLYTCMSVAEQEDFTYEIVAVNYDPNKFLRVEEGIIIDDDPYSKIDVANVQPPTNLSFNVVSRTDAILGPRNDLQVKWSPSASEYVTTYEVYHRVSSGQFERVGLTSVADITIQNIVPGIHEVQIVAINIAGRTSPALLGSYTFQYGGASDLAPPINVYVKGTTGGVFSSPDATITWQDNPANNTKATAVTGWEVAITSDDAAKTVLFTQYISDVTKTEFIYTNAQNRAGGLRRNFRIEVRAADGLGRRSEPGTLAVSNPAPAVPSGVSLIAFFTQYRLVHNRPAESDAVGTLIFASKSPNVTASASTLVYEGTGTFHDVEAEGSTTYYVKFAVYDTFSRDPSLLTISSEYQVTTVNDTTIIPPPATPQNLLLTSTAKNGVVSITAKWDALAAGSFTSYEVSASQGNNTTYLGGFMTGTNSYVFSGVNPLTLYYIRVRAKNAVKDSNFSIESSITTVAADGTGIIQNPPQAPTAVAATASFKSVFLTWKPPAAGGPIDYYEILESATNSVSSATVLGTSTGSGYTRGGLNSGDSRFYWVRSVGPGGTSANSPNTTTGVIGTTVLLATADFQNLSIVNALIADATIDSAKIVSLDASKIKADSVLAGTIKITANGTQTTLSAVQSTASQGVNDAAAANSAAAIAKAQADKGVTDAAAAKAQADKGIQNAAAALGAASAAQTSADRDPATRINQGVTLLDPGKIVIAGGTTLANWRNGGDITAIEGGKIAANTINANSLKIGMRGVQINGLAFAPVKNGNYVTWTAGSIKWVDNNGNVQSVDIAASNSAGGLGTTARPLYIVWLQGRNYLDYTEDGNFVGYQDWVVLATYAGGINLVNNYGGTIIDGDQIVAGTIRGNRIEANTIGAGQITTGELITNTGQIRNGIISTAHIQNAYINNAQISGDIASSNWNGGGNGQPGSAQGWYLQRATGKLYANNIEIRDDSGYILLQSGGSFDFNRVSNRPGTYPSDWNSTYNKPGEFPSNWNAISGKPSEYFINYGNVGNRPYLGQFSALDVLHRGNIGSYIAGAAIGEAWIENGAISNAKIADAQITTLKVANYQISSFLMSEYDNGSLYVRINWQHSGWDWTPLGHTQMDMAYTGRLFITCVNRHFAFFANYGTYYRGRCYTVQQLIWQPPWAGGNYGAVDEHVNYIDLNGNGIYEVSYQYPMQPVLSWGGEVPAGHYNWWYRIYGDTNGLTDSEWDFNYNRSRKLIHYSYR